MRILRLTICSLCLATLLLALLPDAAQARPRGKRGLRGKGQTNILVLLAKADLRLKRLMVAQAAGDMTLSIQELDESQQLLEQTRSWIATQGPAWNNPKTQTALGQVTEAIRFSRFLMEAGLGVEQNLATQVEHFLEQGYKPSQQLSLLVIATQVSLLRGRLEQAQKYSERAQAILASSPQGISPVAKYALASSALGVQRLRGGLGSQQQLLEQFEQATLPLRSYTPGVNPMHDVDWILAREATRTWVEELRMAGPAGVPALVKLFDYNQKLEAAVQRGWDYKKLERMNIKGLPAIYLTFFATHVLLYSHADQQMLVCETLPREEARKRMPEARLKLIEDYVANLPQEAKKYTNPQLGAGFTEFGLGQRGLAKEIAGRTLFLRARRADDADQKLALLERALQQLKLSDNATARVRYLFRVAEIADKLGRSELATKKLTQALEVCQSRGLVLDALRAREALAEHSAAAKNWSQVKEHCGAGLVEIEKAIPLAGGDSQAAETLRARSHRLSSLMAQASVASNDAEGALSALNMGHNLDVAVVQIKAKKEASTDLKLVEQKKDEVAVLSHKVTQLKAMPASSTRDSLLKESEKLLADSRSEFLLQSRQIRQKHSTLYSSVLRFDPLNLPDIQKSLPGDTAVIQYFPTDQDLYIFLVTKEQFRLRSLKLPKAELKKDVNRFLRRVRRPSSNPESVQTLSQALYQKLLGPVEADIAELKTLVFIPAGQLNFLPFGALQNGKGEPLVQLRSFVELAKPTDFIKVAGSKVSELQTVTIFANATGDLPAASLEGEQITAIFSGSKLFKEGQATKVNFLKFGGQGSALHLATHGQWDMSNSLNNYLQLANEEKVTQEEIFELPLDGTSLVTLSACNTAMAKDADVDYVSSLAEAFWIAGARSVVASLWAVDDASTSRLMTEFYSRLKDGKSKVEALREAQLAVRGDAKYAHPHYWAGFVLFGDGR